MTIQDLMADIAVNGNLATEVPDDVAQMFLENSGAVDTLAAEDDYIAEQEPMRFAPEEVNRNTESDYSGYREKCYPEKDKGNGCGCKKHWHDCGWDKQLIRKSVQECEYYRVCKRKVYEPPMKVTNCYPHKKECGCHNPCRCKEY